MLFYYFYELFLRFIYILISFVIVCFLFFLKIKNLCFFLFKPILKIIYLNNFMFNNLYDLIYFYLKLIIIFSLFCFILFFLYNVYYFFCLICYYNNKLNKKNNKHYIKKTE